MTADNLLMQTVADVLDVPVVRPTLTETVALGAAYAAGLGAGLWPDRWALRRHWRQAAEWRPTMDPVRREAEYAGWRRAIDLAIAYGESPRRSGRR
jgi:glycerol kinase